MGIFKKWTKIKENQGQTNQGDYNLGNFNDMGQLEPYSIFDVTLDEEGHIDENNPTRRGLALDFCIEIGMQHIKGGGMGFQILVNENDPSL